MSFFKNLFCKREWVLIKTVTITLKWIESGMLEEGGLYFYVCKNTGLRKVDCTAKFMYAQQYRHKSFLEAKYWVKTGYFFGEKI